MGKRKPSIGRVQLEILQYVTEHQPVTVREVANYMAETAGKARTTILTLMEQLRQKRYLKRRKVDGLYRYSPTASSTDVVRRLVKEFVETTLSGSVSPFVAYLMEDADVSDAELVELKRLVRALDAQREEQRT